MRILPSLCLAAAMLLGPAAAMAQNSAPVAGKWAITIEFICGKAAHTAVITQKDSTLSGVYKGTLGENQLRGQIKDGTVTFSSNLRHESADAPFRFTGTVQGDTMRGTVDMGEYWTAKFTATRVDK